MYRQLSKVVAIAFLLAAAESAVAELKKNVLKIGYGIPFVAADVDEGEINPNQYDGYNLDAHRAKLVQLIWSGNGQLEHPLSFKYISLDTKDDAGLIEKNSYQSYTIGVSQGNWMKLLEGIDGYGIVDIGVGISRFSFDKVRNHMHADICLEAGLGLARTLTVGAAVNYQMVGYPSETIAYVGLFSVNLGIRF